MSKKKSLAKDRAWDLDFLRGIALLMMLFMHMSWDVRYEFGVDVFSYLEKGWFWSFIHPIIVVLFVSVSGICCTFSRNNVKRGLKLLAATLALDIGTFIATYYVGINCLIIQGPNSHFGHWHYVIGIMLTVIAVGHFLKRIKILVKGLKQIKK